MATKNLIVGFRVSVFEAKLSLFFFEERTEHFSLLGSYTGMDMQIFSLLYNREPCLCILHAYPRRKTKEPYALIFKKWLFLANSSFSFVVVFSIDFSLGVPRESCSLVLWQQVGMHWPETFSYTP